MWEQVKGHVICSHRVESGDEEGSSELRVGEQIGPRLSNRTSVV